MSASVGAHITAQVYMHPHQMAHCLQDAAVMELVEQGHLKLIYIDSAPEIFTSCKKVKRSGSFNSTVAADEQVSCTSRISGLDLRLKCCMLLLGQRVKQHQAKGTEQCHKAMSAGVCQVHVRVEIRVCSISSTRSWQ